ncbi:hypothetical protein TREES_T100013421 [Tupaia chinensis]|uniref:Uncharacterized protein n=1 Tax=Tupaia chinensis TaxID=246437 RepID=L9JAP9_TUPCH|nr:hypothetical protein TREES_T100013421 [Tupaia chinensis]
MDPVAYLLYRALLPVNNSWVGPRNACSYTPAGRGARQLRALRNCRACGGWARKWRGGAQRALLRGARPRAEAPSGHAASSKAQSSRSLSYLSGDRSARAGVARTPFCNFGGWDHVRGSRDFARKKKFARRGLSDLSKLGALLPGSGLNSAAQTDPSAGVEKEGVGPTKAAGFCLARALSLAQPPESALRCGHRQQFSTLRKNIQVQKGLRLEGRLDGLCYFPPGLKARWKTGGTDWPAYRGGGGEEGGVPLALSPPPGGCP